MPFFWKFLQPGAVSTFSEHRWMPAEWQYSSGQRTECRTGFHACRIQDMPYWLNDELWSIELAEPIRIGSRKVISNGARLRFRVAGWDSSLAREMGEVCGRRTAEHAAAELREAGLAEEGDALLHTTLASIGDNWVVVAQHCADVAANSGADQAARLCMYVLDAVELIDLYPVATMAYLAARAANQRSSAETHDPFDAERRWQARWLATRLHLPEG